MSKYDWSNVPEYINFIAVDPDGWAYGYKEKPVRADSGFQGEFSHYLLKPQTHGYVGNWCESLEERLK